MTPQNKEDPGGCHGPRAIRRGLLLVLSLWLAAGISGPAAHAAQSVEYQVKAVFLFNFATFVEWPEPDDTATEAESPFVIGIVGEDPFGSTLDEVVAQEMVEGRAIVVQRFPRIEDIGPCDILYVSRSETYRLNEVLEQVEGRPVLTVADIPGFAEFGGMIGFTTERGRVRVKINSVAVDAASLAVNTKLLRLAQVVTPSARG